MFIMSVSCVLVKFSAMQGLIPSVGVVDARKVCFITKRITVRDTEIKAHSHTPNPKTKTKPLKSTEQ